MFKNLNPSFLGISGHQSEIIELALTYGFSSIDLNITDFATRVRLKGLPYAKRLIDSAKVRVGNFKLPIDWDADEDIFNKELKKLPEYTDVAVSVGCKRCFAVLAPAGDKRPYHENFEFHRRRFQEIGAVLKDADIRLAVGFQAAEYLRRNRAFQFIHDLEALTLLINMIDLPNVGLLLDVWDIFAAGGSLEIIRKLAPEQIVAVNVSEISAETQLSELDEKSRLLPGIENGQINVGPILAYLSEVNYDGPVSVKACRAAFTTRRRDNIVKLTSEALDKVWREAGLPLTESAFVASARD